MATRLGVFQAVPYSSQILFGIANSAIMYSAILEPDLISSVSVWAFILLSLHQPQQGYYNWIKTMGSLDDSLLQNLFREPLEQNKDQIQRFVDAASTQVAGASKISRRVWRRLLALAYFVLPMERLRRLFHTSVQITGRPLYRRFVAPLFPHTPWPVAHFMELPLLFQKAVRLYGPVHAVPALLFRARKLLQHPIVGSFALVRSVAQSSAFLAAYVFVFKYVLTGLRDIYQYVAVSATHLCGSKNDRCVQSGFAMAPYGRWSHHRPGVVPRD